MPNLAVRRAVCFALASVVLAAGCSSDDRGGGGSGSTAAPGATAGSSRPTPQRPAGPVADLSQELTGGTGVFLGASSPSGVADGWIEQEYVATGSATSYVSDGDFPADGRFVLRPGEQADYRTRVVVRRPEKPADFEGTVVVEWLNVSGGVDANPDYAFLADEIVRRGHAWVGVSAQRIGVEGGEVAVGIPLPDSPAGKGLKVIDPARYGSLAHPGDAFSYDIYTQVARALRAGGGLGDLRPDQIIAVGESQSAFALTTYINGVAPLTQQFDGFFVHSRGAAALPLGARDQGTSIAQAISGTPVQIRTDQDVPVLVLETETDVTSVLGYHAARQPDSPTFRLWEVAGTAHADASLLGALAERLDCGTAINDGPQRFVVRAALRALDSWARTGVAPPEAPRLEVDAASGRPVMRRDADGNALGGIRLPQVLVPVATLSGEPGPKGGTICLLLGSTVPFSDDRLAALHPTRIGYLNAYARAADAAVSAGFVLADDRQALMEDAEPTKIPG